MNFVKNNNDINTFPSYTYCSAPNLCEECSEDWGDETREENMCKHTGGECFCILRLNVIKYSTYLC